MSVSSIRVTTLATLLLLIAGCGGAEPSSNDASAPADTAPADSTPEKQASALDTVSLTSLLPAENVHGLLFDYSDELMDFHLEDRGGALAGHAAHWDQPGEFSASGMVRVFRYRTSKQAQRNREADRVRPDMHATDTVIDGREAFFVLDTSLYDDGSVTVLAKIDHVDGSTEIEAFSQHHVPGLSGDGSRTLAEATADAIALFRATVNQGLVGGQEAEEEEEGPSRAQAARSEERARRLGGSLQQPGIGRDEAS